MSWNNNWCGSWTARFSWQTYDTSSKHQNKICKQIYLVHYYYFFK